MEVGEENSAVFLAEVKEALSNGKSSELKEIILEDNNKHFIQSLGWDLLSVVGSYLKEKANEVETNLDCVVIIERIAQVGNPKELFIGLLEQLDTFLDSAVARLFFRPLQIVLQKFGPSKSLYLDQALEQLHACIQGIPLPQYEGLDEKQRRLLIQDEEYQRLEETCVDLVEFVAPFVFEVKEKISGIEKDDLIGKKEFRTTLKSRKEIEKYLLRLLEYPLAFLEVDYKTKERASFESGLCSCTRQIMSYLSDMQCSFSSLFEYVPDHAEDTLGDDQQNLSMLGISHLVYMVQTLGLSASRVPAIHSADYLLALHKVHVATLMKKTEEPALFKGLELLDHLVSQIDNLVLRSSLLLDDTYMKIPEALIHVMVGHSSEVLRKKAVGVLPVYINKFDWKGRYRLLTVLLSSAEHSGVKGLLIGLIKDNVHQSLQNDDKSNSWFLDSHLRTIFPTIFHLSNGSETDLLEESDMIIAALNFLRYMLLRDPRGTNRTAVWSVIGQLEQGYLSELVTGLEMSRLHYKQREEELLDEKKRAKLAKEGDNLSVSVGGQEIGKMPFKQQMQVLTSAQFTFDLMQSLLGRVNEIISQR